MGLEGFWDSPAGDTLFIARESRRQGATPRIPYGRAYIISVNKAGGVVTGGAYEVARWGVSRTAG